MSFEISGKIIAVLDKRNGISASTNTPWSVQQYVIETHEQYPKSYVLMYLEKTKSISSTFR